MLYFLIAGALLFGFLNGFNGAGSIVSTVISSRAMRPRNALLMTATAQFIAPFIFGVAVANTISKDLLQPGAISLSVVITATLAAIIWSAISWFFGVPSSSSHALVGGLIGAAFLASGPDAIQTPGLVKVLLSLFLSPPFGLLVGFLFMQVIYILFQNATPRINVLFKRLQILTAFSLGLSYGANDAQKPMGLITLGLVIAGVQQSFQVPVWVIAASAGAMSLGALTGGWRLIHTLGGRIYKIRPIHAFASQASAAMVVLGASLTGGPVSTTQVISSAIMGAGAAERLTKVRWQVAQTMLVAWVMTIPATALTAGLLFIFFRELF